MPSQEALLDQLVELRRLAIEHGLYDADDWIVAHMVFQQDGQEGGDRESDG